MKKILKRFTFALKLANANSALQLQEVKLNTAIKCLLSIPAIETLIAVLVDCRTEKSGEESFKTILPSRASVSFCSEKSSLHLVGSEKG